MDTQVPRTREGLPREEEGAHAALLSILESMSDGFVAMDFEYRHTLVNSAYEKFAGRPRDQLLGRSLWELFPEVRGSPLGAACERAMCERIPQQVEEYFLPLGMWLEARAFPSPQGLSVLFRDVTQVRRAQQLQTRRARQAALGADVGAELTRGQELRGMLQQCAEALVKHLDAAFARIWTLNPREQVLELQASAGLYTHLDGPHGRVPVGQYKIGRIAEQKQPHLTNDVLNDSQLSNPEWARREGMVSFAGYPLALGGRVVGVMAMFAREPLSQDTLEALASVADSVALGIQRLLAEAERERLIQALERSNAELDQFAYVASHDLKAPLRGIANLSQWLEEDLGTAINDSARGQLELLRGRVQRMEALIDGILNYSRAGRVRHKAEVVDVRRVVQEVVELLAPKPGAKIELGSGFPILTTERVPLQQVFLNIIGNALKHARREDPLVQISANEAGAFIQFTVRDNGQGIAPEFHERIWGLFQTLEPRDTVEGTGIGLSVVKKTAESRGGRAWVESAPLQGAAFHFTWPKNGG